MKHLLLMNTMIAGSQGLAEWPKKDADAHLAYWDRLDRELSEACESIGVEAIPGPESSQGYGESHLPPLHPVQGHPSTR
jgi:hypothetical protein